jgi:hypothetical protein
MWNIRVCLTLRFTCIMCCFVLVTLDEAEVSIIMTGFLQDISNLLLFFKISLDNSLAD